MGTGRFAGNGVAADSGPGFVFWNFATGICGWLSAGRAGLLDRVSVFRLARIIRSRCAAGAAGRVHPGSCSRIAGLAALPRPEKARAAGPGRIHQATRNALRPCRAADDGV